MENKFRFYNTLTRQIETVIPHEDGKIAMYADQPCIILRTLEIFAVISWKMCLKKDCAMSVMM